MSLISVIVPVYNVENYLRACLDSILAQTFHDYEIIVVNDGATDGSQAIIDDYQKKHPTKIFSYQKENGGLSDARNYGISKSSGEYLCFIDSDDAIENKYLEALMSAIKEQKADIAVCDMVYRYEEGIDKFSSGGDFTIANVSSMPELLAINNSACNKLFHKDLFKDTKFIKGIWYEDLATIPQIIFKAHNIVKVNQALYIYNQRSTSIVHTQNAKIFDIYQALSAVREAIDHQKNKSDLIKVFHQMVINQAIYLTNLRIKEYVTGHKAFYLRNHQMSKQLYPLWYFNSLVWSSGFKRWIAYTLFYFKQFTILQSLYQKS